MLKGEAMMCGTDLYFTPGAESVQIKMKMQK
jgi:hypothetical protein